MPIKVGSVDRNTDRHFNTEADMALARMETVSRELRGMIEKISSISPRERELRLLVKQCDTRLAHAANCMSRFSTMEKTITTAIQKEQHHKDCRCQHVDGNLNVVAELAFDTNVRMKTLEKRMNEMESTLTAVLCRLSLLYDKISIIEEAATEAADSEESDSYSGESPPLFRN
jgi:chromosome segregation ATPase